MRIIMLFFFLAVFSFCKTEKKEGSQTVAMRGLAERWQVDTIFDLKDTIFTIGSHTLTFTRIDSLFIPAIYEDATVRDSIGSRFGNWHEGAQAVENYLAKGAAANFKRTGASLALHLDSGRTLTLLDSDEGGDNYTFEHFFEEAGMFLIRVQWNEGNNYLVVNRKNGSKKYVIGKIYPSASSHILSINEDLDAGYSNNGLQLLTKQSGTLVTNFTLEGSTWAPVLAKAVNDSVFVLKIIKRLPSDAPTYRSEYYQLMVR